MAIKIPRRYQRLVFAFFMSAMMSCLMSAVITSINVGWPTNFFFLWMRAWGTAFLVAFPAIFMLSPIVNALVRQVMAD